MKILQKEINLLFHIKYIKAPFAFSLKLDILKDIKIMIFFLILQIKVNWYYRLRPPTFKLKGIYAENMYI